MNRLFAVFILGFVLVIVRAQGQSPDDQYVQIYNVMKEADALNQKGQANQALAKYLEAQSALQRFQRGYPEWNSQVVKFRLEDLQSKVAALSGGTPTVPETTSENTRSPQSTSVARPTQAPSSTSNDSQAQLSGLQEQVRQLQADKTILEAKLKEAFAAQPVPVDPAELTKAEETITTLQKENDLLKVSLNQARARQTPANLLINTSNNSLDEVNRKLTEQTLKAEVLAQEKTALQNRLDSLTSSNSQTSSLEKTKTALTDATRRLAEQKEATAKLTLERDTLQNRLRAANSDSQALSALRTENQMLKKQLADLKAPAPTTLKNAISAQPAKAESPSIAPSATEEQQNQQKVALENRLKELSGESVSPAPSPTRSSPQVTTNLVDANRIKQLERERDDLQHKLEAALRKSSGHKTKNTGTRVEELESQLASLRARLEVFEARQVPYTAEELALFKSPEPKFATAAEAKPAKKSTKPLPAGAASLVVEAQRYFADKQLDKAEAKYIQVLHQDEKNVYTLANLAMIQLELGHLGDAEKHINQAIALDPDDAYSRSILGYLRFKQKRYDDALDALSRAAKIDPASAEIQNYLGLTLAEKGLRGQAETALRKALQIDPAYGSAHNNLAVIYLSQQPPAVELARWHYQKALAVGHARNPELEKMLVTKKRADKSP